MRDWGVKDMPAAVEFLQAQRPGKTLVGAGHSVGGQMLGISGMAANFERYAMVAVNSGYLRLLRHPLRDSILMNAVALPVARVTGRTHRFMGLGEPLPGSVFADWARWCRAPDYFMSDPAIPETALMREVTTPMLVVRHHDDVWGTEKAIGAMMGYYPNAPKDHLVHGPDAANGAAIGHLGFFRSKFAQSLWPDVINWLLTGRHAA